MTSTQMIMTFNTQIQKAQTVYTACAFLMWNDSTYLHKMINTSKSIWTNGVECGKICIGEQPG